MRVANTPLESRRPAVDESAWLKGGDAHTRITPRLRDVTPDGWLLSLLVASSYLSTIPALRIDVAGLSFHPYLVIAIFAVPRLRRTRAVSGRSDLRGWGPAFVIGMLVLGLPAVGDEGARAIAVKWVAAGVTFWVARGLISSRADFELARLTLVAAAAAVGGRTLLRAEEAEYFLNPLSGIGSRNAYSFWALPAMYMGFDLLATRRRRFITSWQGALLIAMLGTITLTIFLTLNRSGWLIAVGSFVAVAIRRASPKTALVALTLAFLTARGIDELGFWERVESRYRELREGTEADDLRKEIVRVGLELFVENPFIGTTQARLPQELGSRLGFPEIESHNLLVEIIAGTGSIGAFLAIGWGWRYVGTPGRLKGVSFFLTGFLALVVLRGLAGNEIVFNPLVLMGLGIARGGEWHLVGRFVPADSSRTQKA